MALVGQRSAAWNAGMNVALPVLALCLLATARLARHAPFGLLAWAGVLMVGGVCLFAVAKASLLRQKRWVSFGTAHMNRRHGVGDQAATPGSRPARVAAAEADH